MYLFSMLTLEQSESMNVQEKRKMRQWLWPLLLLAWLVGGGISCGNNEVDWKEGIVGSTFHDFETTLYLGEIPETIDKEKSTYLYYPNKVTILAGMDGSDSDEQIDNGYFHYKKYTAYPLTENSDVIMDIFLQNIEVPANGMPVLLSGKMEEAPQLLIGGSSTVFLLNVTSIKKK